MSEIKNRVSEILSKDGMIKNIMFECVRELENFDSEQQIEFLWNYYLQILGNL